MPSYVVEWCIDVDADSPREAAQQAWETMRRPKSTANVFDVIDPKGETKRIDLQVIWELSQLEKHILDCWPCELADIPLTPEGEFRQAVETLRQKGLIDD